MSTKISSYILPRLQDILFFCVFYLVIVLGQHMLNADGDLPRHLLAGRLIIQNRAIPTTEPFIYPYFGRTYISHEWLSDVIFYLTDHIFGLAGIVLLSAILLATSFTLLFSSLSTQTNYRIPAIILVIWGTMATIPNWITRPYLFSILFLAIWLIAADRLVRDDATPIWPFPVLMIIWSNLHGEFIAGILVSSAYAAGWLWDYLFNRESVKVETGKRLWLALILSIVASFIQPGGIQSWVTMFGFLNNHYLSSLIVDAQSPNFQQPTFSLLLGLLIFSIFVLSIKKDRLPTGQAFLLAGFSAMSLLAARNIHLYTVVAPFVLIKSLTPNTEIKFLSSIENTLRNVEGKARGIFWPLTTIILSCIFILGGSRAQNYRFDRNSFPVDAVSWLQNHPQSGNMFNDINWGGYIELNLWPQQSMFIDSIGDFSGDITKEYISVMSLSDGWQDVFSKYNIAWAIVRPDSKLAGILKNELHWNVIYEDQTAIILRH